MTLAKGFLDAYGNIFKGEASLASVDSAVTQ
jgi:hypothetical protein